MRTENIFIELNISVQGLHEGHQTELTKELPVEEGLLNLLKGLESTVTSWVCKRFEHIEGSVVAVRCPNMT